MGRNVFVDILKNSIKNKNLPNLFWHNKEDNERKKFLIEFYMFIKLDEIANII